MVLFEEVLLYRSKLQEPTSKRNNCSYSTLNSRGTWRRRMLLTSTFKETPWEIMFSFYFQTFRFCTKIKTGLNMYLQTVIFIVRISPREIQRMNSNLCTKSPFTKYVTLVVFLNEVIYTIIEKALLLETILFFN